MGDIRHGLGGYGLVRQGRFYGSEILNGEHFRGRHSTGSWLHCWPGFGKLLPHVGQLGCSLLQRVGREGAASLPYIGEHHLRRYLRKPRLNTLKPDTNLIGYLYTFRLCATVLNWGFQLFQQRLHRRPSPSHKAGSLLQLVSQLSIALFQSIDTLNHKASPNLLKPGPQRFPLRNTQPGLGCFCYHNPTNFQDSTHCSSGPWCIFHRFCNAVDALKVGLYPFRYPGHLRHRNLWGILPHLLKGVLPSQLLHGALGLYLLLQLFNPHLLQHGLSDGPDIITVCHGIQTRLVSPLRLQARIKRHLFGRIKRRSGSRGQRLDGLVFDVGIDHTPCLKAKAHYPTQTHHLPHLGIPDNLLAKGLALDNLLVEFLARLGQARKNEPPTNLCGSDQPLGDKAVEHPCRRGCEGQGYLGSIQTGQLQVVHEHFIRRLFCLK